MDAAYARTTGSSATASYVLSDTPTGSDIPAVSLDPDDPTQDITNAVTVPIRTYSVDTEEVLWTLGETTELEAEEVLTFVVEYPNEQSPQSHIAVDSWSALVSGTDYTANAAADGSGADRTSSLSVTATPTATALTLTVENTSASNALFITLLQAKGQALVLEPPTQVHSENAESIAAYGRRSYLAPAQFLDSTRDGSDYAEFIVQLLREANTRISASFDGTERPMIAADLELSDRLEVSIQGIAEDYFVEAIEHIIGQGRRHAVNLLLSPAEPYGSVIVLDQGPGLDEGLLGR